MLSHELFFEAHRGIGLIRGERINPNVGVHWSMDKEKATEIGNKTARMLRDSRRKETPTKTTVLHGRIPISSAETDVDSLKKLGWGFSEQDVHHWLKHDPLGEKEVMVKQNAPVLVTGSTTYTPGRSRKRTYNPPREMKA